MANYLIAEQTESRLLLLEKQWSRFGFGGAFLLFGSVICLLAAIEIVKAPSVGPVLGLLLGMLCVIAGMLSIARRGWIRLDQQEQICEYMGGSRKFRFSAARIEFQNVEKVLIRTSTSGAHRSHGLVLVLKDNSEERLDSTSDASCTNFLAQEIAERIGCVLEGSAA